jgi:DNA-directed RNA polymerase beta subunit
MDSQNRQQFCFSKLKTLSSKSSYCKKSLSCFRRNLLATRTQTLRKAIAFFKELLSSESLRRRGVRCPKKIIGQQQFSTSIASLTVGTKKGRGNHNHKTPPTNKAIMNKTNYLDIKKVNTKLFSGNIINNSEKLMNMEYSLNNFHRSNQDTCLVHKPSVFPGEWVQSGDLLADCSASIGGELALGQNILIAYMPWEGYNFEDAILVSERLVYDDLYTSIHIERYEVEIRDTKLGFEEITCEIPDVAETSIQHLHHSGIAKLGSWIEEGDILVGKTTPISQKPQSNYQKLLYTILDKPLLPVRDSSLRAPKGIKAKVIGIQIFKKNQYTDPNIDLVYSNSFNTNKMNLLHSSSFKSIRSLPRIRQIQKSKSFSLLKKEDTFKFLSPLNKTKNKTIHLKNYKSFFTSNKFLQFYKSSNSGSSSSYRRLLPLLRCRNEAPSESLRRRGGVRSPSSKRLHRSPQQKREIFQKTNSKTINKPNFTFLRKDLSLDRKKPSTYSSKNEKRTEFLRRKIQKRNLFDSNQNKIKDGGGYRQLPPSFLKIISSIQVYLAEKRRIQIGDKMAGRHGNKGIISQILPPEDMPFLPDGTPLDMVLNPLGVPSRMNVGQIYECLLGLAGKHLGENYKIFPFDEIYGPEASRSFVYSKLNEARVKTGKQWLFNPNSPGKMRLYDGRTGDTFDQTITVGYAYMLRLVHMVDDKIHARSTGPYSLVTQQPLRGRSNQGGQRLGEMEVWALEGYGAAFTLLEMLTIKSDDMTGRMTLWSNLILNKEISIGTPESFKVLICELQALCLDIGLFRVNSKTKKISQNKSMLTVGVS